MMVLFTNYMLGVEVNKLEAVISLLLSNQYEKQVEIIESLLETLKVKDVQ